MLFIWWQKTLVYDVSYKNLIWAKPLLIRFDKIDRFIRIYEETRYLTLFGFERYNVLNNRMRYLINLKSSIKYVFSRYYAKIKVDSYDSLLKQKRLTIHNVIILIK